MKISIIWWWAFGFAILKYLSEKHPSIKFYVFDTNKDLIYSLNKLRKHPYFFVEYKILENVFPSEDLQESVHNTDLIILALPSQHIRSCIKEIKPYIKKGVYILNLSKWLEWNGLLPINKIISEEITETSFFYAVLSWWMIASDLFDGKPLWAQLWVRNLKDAWFFLKILRSDQLDIQVTEWNISEIEILWAIKNIVAIYCWFLEWSWYPASTVSYELCKLLQQDIPFLVKSLWWISSISFSDYAYWWDLLTTVFWDSRSKYFWRLLWEWLPLNVILDRFKNEHKTSEWYTLLEKLLKHAKIAQWVDFLRTLKVISNI